MKGSVYLGLLLQALPCLCAWGQISGDIVGGGHASPGEYPWVVALVEADTPDNFNAQFCGGTLIHPRWVVTAAHCVDGVTSASIEVIIGAYDLDDPSAVRTPVKSIVVHPDYNWWTEDSDVALIELATPADAPWIPMVSDTTLDEADILATVTGWGATNRFGTLFPSRLQEVEVPIVSNDVANKRLSYNGDITGNMLAAGYAAGGSDSCGGDSGGPMVVYNADIDSWVLVGVVSWGDGCARPLKYGIYSRMYNFRHWALGHLMHGYRAYEDAHGIRGRLHDPDQDGYPNLLEYAHNSDPNHYVAAYKPQPVLAEVEGRPVPAIRYRRLINTPVIDYHPEISRDDGATWMPIDPIANQVGPAETIDTYTDRVTIRDPEASASGSHAAIRVRISQQP